MKKLIITFISLGILAGGIYFLLRLAPIFLQKLEPEGPSLATLPPAPDFTLLDLNNNKIKLSDFRGKNVILNFWTSWNRISSDQLKILNHKSLSAPDLIVLTINSQEDKDLVKAIQNQENITIPILLDTEGEAGELYGIRTLPLTIFINKTGLEIERVVGPLSLDEISSRIK